jgi:hypothetical protein
MLNTPRKGVKTENHEMNSKVPNKKDGYDGSP